jgi:myosin heavy subunit
MPFHWQSQVNPSNVGVEDMVLLQQISDEAIVENLRKRLTGRSMFVGFLHYILYYYDVK